MQTTVKFKFFGDKKCKFFRYFMSFFTAHKSFSESFITFKYSLYEFLTFCAILPWPNKLSKNIEGGLPPKNLLLLPQGQKLHCILDASMEVFSHFKLY
jgi:hypothetical protein